LSIIDHLRRRVALVQCLQQGGGQQAEDLLLVLGVEVVPPNRAERLMRARRHAAA
jgi:hypothetical protein